jgi:chemotaxis protein histidine kinase CheA
MADHNGHVEVKSERGRGSGFVLRFPISRVEESAVAADSQKLAGSVVSK